MILQTLSFLVGALCLFWGYRLLMRGIYAGADSHTVWSDRSLLFKRSAPGVIFALFGAMVIAVPLLRSHDHRAREAAAPAAQERIENSAPAAPAQPSKRKHVREDGSRSRGAPQQRTLDATTTPTETAPDATSPAEPAAKAWKPGRA